MDYKANSILEALFNKEPKEEESEVTIEDLMRKFYPAQAVSLNVKPTAQKEDTISIGEKQFKAGEAFPIATKEPKTTTQQTSVQPKPEPKPELEINAETKPKVESIEKPDSILDYIPETKTDAYIEKIRSKTPTIEEPAVPEKVEKPETETDAYLEALAGISRIGEYLQSDSGQQMLTALTIATNQPGSAGVKAAEYLNELHQADLLNRAVQAETPEERIQALKHMSPQTVQMYEGIQTGEVQREKLSAETENIEGLFEQQFKLAQYDASTRKQILEQTYDLKSKLADVEASYQNPLERKQKMQNIIQPHIKATERLLEQAYGEEITTVDGDVEWNITNPIAYGKALYETVNTQLQYAVDTGVMTSADKELYLRKYKNQFLDSLSESEAVEENLNAYPTELGQRQIGEGEDAVVKDVLYVYDVPKEHTKIYYLDKDGVEYSETYKMHPEDIKRFKNEPASGTSETIAGIDPAEVNADVNKVLKDPRALKEMLEKYKELGIVDIFMEALNSRER
jgi:hypothetical protein